MKDIIFREKALEELQDWEKTNQLIFSKIIRLIEEIQTDPFGGLGKPEPLKYEKQGYWSRRITKEHRLVYKLSENSIIIVSCKFHY